MVVGNVKNAYEIIEYSFGNNSINDFCNVNEKNILWDDISSGKSKSINNDGGEITSIQEYLKNYVGESYTYTYSDANSNVLSGTGTYTMEELDSDEANCCTLVALANAMIYYRNKKG